MKIKYYFKNSDSEICYDLNYYMNYMRNNNLNEIDVFEAIPTIIGHGIFWCKEHAFCGDDSREFCGINNCNEYKPKNKISGACMHHTHWLFEHGNKIILKLF